jgi:hypothetical protein
MALVASACGGDSGYRSPTAPPAPTTPAPPASPVVWWYGSWTFDQATPAGDCLAEALNDFRYGIAGWGLRLDFQAEAGRARLRFSYEPGNDPNEGFWPLEFTGTIGPDGAIRASVPDALIGALRTDPWMELCYWEWSMQGGELQATLSPDGRRLSGTVVETFRASFPPPDKDFTIHSHFTADAR